MANSFARLGAFPTVLAAVCCVPALGQDCGVWTRLDPPGVSSRSTSAMVFEVARARVTMFGGKKPPYGSPTFETWS